VNSGTPLFVSLWHNEQKPYSMNFTGILSETYRNAWHRTYLRSTNLVITRSHERKDSVKALVITRYTDTTLLYNLHYLIFLPNYREE